MKVEFDPEADALYVTLSGRDIVNTDEVKPGIILDYDKNGEVVGIEMLYVSRRAHGQTATIAQQPPD